MVFRLDSPAYSTELQRKEGETILYVNYLGVPLTPSIADSAEVMARVIDALTENPEVSRIIFVQQRNYNYPFNQISFLLEIAQLYTYLLRQEHILSPDKLSLFANLEFAPREISYLLSLLRQDPAACYLEINKRLAVYKRNYSSQNVQHFDAYLGILERFKDLLSKTKLISSLIDVIDTYAIGDRKIYASMFRPDVLPNFTLTRLVAQLPEQAELIDQYELKSGFETVPVMILKVSGDAKYLYHIMPPEYSLSEEHHSLLNLGKNVLLDYQPKSEEFVDSEKMRSLFFNVARDLVSELSLNKKIQLNYRELNSLARILVRQTIGFGLIEVLLFDENLQDIFLNSPIGQNSVFVRHSKYGDCVTNILPSYEDADSWASKLRLQSGRPLDEANPILDTDLFFGNIRARVAAIQRPLSPTGIAYALRRHREEPWTLPLFINNRMINSFTAGLLSFLIDGNRTLLIAGTRSSGKTSLLGSAMLEIIPSVRTIVIEDTLELPVDSLRKLGYNIQRMKVRSALLDATTEIDAAEGIRASLRMGDSALIVGEVRSSIRGDEEVVIVENKEMKRIQIKEIEGRDISNIYVPTVGFDLKTKLSKLTGFVKHPKRNKLLRIKTRTGREVTVTPDHSLFSPTKNFEISPIECKDLKVGSSIVLPSFMSCGFNDIKSINVFNYLPEFRVKNFEKEIRDGINVLGWKKATELSNINCGDIYNYFRTNQQTNIPFSSFTNIMNAAQLCYSLENLEVKKGTSLSIPAQIPVNEDFCRFLGYYVSEGYHYLKEKAGGGVIIKNSDKNIGEDIINISQTLFKLAPKKREFSSLGKTVQYQIHCLPLAKLISKLGCGRTSYEKRAPSFIFGLSKEKIAAFLRGLYSGDGNFTSSNSSGNCVRYYSTSKKLVEDVSYLLLNFGIVGKIYKRIPHGISNAPIWIIEFKERKMVKTFLREIGFVRKIPEIIERKWEHSPSNSVKLDSDNLKKHLVKYPRKYRHLFRFLKCSKNYLEKVVSDPECIVSDKLKTFALGDFFLDEVKEINEINLEEGEYVYDLSVEPSQNFVGGFGGVLLHNTEAKALYEAMRVGALANLVAGTIHGASPYGVFDRVVNDLGVPVTSFKATDTVVVANPIRTPDGMHYKKRVTQLTEVRKHWTRDPEEEKGFVDLIKYNVEKDELEPTEDLMNGDSEIIKAIAGTVKGWAGNWDAVWDNILLRAKIKQEIVDVSRKIQMPQIMESKFNALSNDMFHRISEKITSEVGLPVSERVFPEWRSWLMNNVKKV